MGYNIDIMDTKGKFIVFEGTDGSGKTTQIKLLSKYLKEKGEQVYLTCEPTESPFGGLLRACLGGRMDTDERAIAALFAVDRLDHILNPVNGIKKKLEEGFTVLCDRYYLSSFAYNGEFVPLEWVISLNEQAMKELRPDLVLYLDLPPEECMKRVSRRGEVERYESLDKQLKIRERYLSLFERFKGQENIRVVVSEEDKMLTQEHIRAVVNEAMGF